jgi:hypothetical protein
LEIIGEKCKKKAPRGTLRRPKILVFIEYAVRDSNPEPTD